MSELGRENARQGHVVCLANSSAAFNLPDELFDGTKFKQTNFFDAFGRQQFADVFGCAFVEEAAMDWRAIRPLGPLSDDVWQPRFGRRFEQMLLAQAAQLHSRVERIAKLNQPHIQKWKAPFD